MATIHKEVVVEAPAAFVWDAVRDVAAIHTRLTPGFVTDTKMEDNGGFRIVTFADGLVLRERIIALDDDARRFVWSVVGAPYEHHNASLQVFEDERGCRMVWTADLMPNDLADTVAQIMESGLALGKRTLEAATTAAHGDASFKFGLENVVFVPWVKPTLHHVSLFVSDMAVTTQFYTDGLGLTLRQQFDNIVGRGTADEFGLPSTFLEAGDGRYIELHPAGQGAMSSPGFPLNHLAFGVTDVDAAYAKALANGGQPFDIPKPGQPWDGSPLNVVMAGDKSETIRMAFLLGPNRELVELYQPLRNAN